MSYDPFRNYTAILSRVRRTWLAGAAAGNVTLTGISTADRLIAVWKVASSSAAAAGTNSAVVTGFNAGAHTVTNGEDTANTCSIATGLTAPDAYLVMILRAGKVVSSDPAVSLSGADIVVADGATYVLTENDVIHWVAYDASDRVLTPIFTGSAPAQTGAVTDLTSEFSITAANTINNVGGTSSANALLFVEWEDHDLGETTNPAHLDDA